MKALIVAFTALTVFWGTLSAADVSPPGETEGGRAAVFAPCAALSTFALAGYAVPGDWEGRAGCPQRLEGGFDFDGEETKARRFEIVFLTSLPVSALLTLLGTVAFRSVAGTSDDFTSVEYGYLALSTVGVSLGIAVSDYIKTGSGRPHRRDRR
jgi:hypothetical protein